MFRKPRCANCLTELDAFGGVRFLTGRSLYRLGMCHDCTASLVREVWMPAPKLSEMARVYAE